MGFEFQPTWMQVLASHLLVASLNLRASLIAQLVKNLPAIRRPRFHSWVGMIQGEGIGYSLQYSWASIMAQLVKNLPAMWETWVRSLGWEDPLEKGKATHSSTVA